MTSYSDVARDLFCGCMSGWGQVVSMMPFQNIKIKLISKPQKYNQGYFHAIKLSHLQQGLLGFYKGMLMPLIGVGAQVSLQFGIVETLKKVMKRNYSNPDNTLDAKYSVFCGLLAGTPSAMVVTPLDHARFKVTLAEKKQGSVKTAIKIYRQYGFQKLYLGFYSTALRESIGLAAYFGVYDSLIRNFTTNGKVSLLGALFSGGLAGMVCWTSMYPVDYIKTLIQSDSLQNPKYKSTMSCVRQQFSKNSLKTFFTGFEIMILRAFVVNACGFMCFEIGKKLMYK